MVGCRLRKLNRRERVQNLKHPLGGVEGGWGWAFDSQADLGACTSQTKPLVCGRGFKIYAKHEGRLRMVEGDSVVVQCETRLGNQSVRGGNDMTLVAEDGSEAAERVKKVRQGLGRLFGIEQADGEGSLAGGEHGRINAIAGQSLHQIEGTCGREDGPGMIFNE